MKRKKVIELLLISALTTALLCSPVSAVTTSSTLDNSLTGSLTLHKLIENDGQSATADGLVNEDESREGISDIGFSYLKIADVVTVNEAGVSGVYYTNLSKDFMTILSSLSVDLESTTIGNHQYYDIESMENAVAAVNQAEGDGSQFTGQTKLTDLVASGSRMPMTDATGTSSVSDMPLGLYLVAETDISAHDGLDENNQPYNQSPNPEAPIIESPADPFLIAIPMTNTATIGGNEAGTVWQYDIDVYPKDQTNSITKKIIDTDQKDQGKLRDTEDYQIGDTVSQLIYADAPKLQPGRTHKSYKISDTMTDGLSFDQLVKVSYGASVQSPDEEQDFSAFQDFSSEDYVLTVAEDKHSFDVSLTDTGLAKLDAISANSQVVVYFDSVLNNQAKIGTDPSNENHPTLTWRNSNTLEKSYQGNHVYDYTYQLNVLKRGVDDASVVTFELSKDGTNLSLVEEQRGYYHIYDQENDAASAATQEIHPSKDGHLYIKGLDSTDYLLTETKTEVGKNLLGAPIKVSFQAADPGRDGNLTKAQIEVGTTTSSLTHSNGIAEMTVDNRDGLTLKTGGSGLTAIYVGAASLLGVTAAGYIVLCKKRKKIQ